MQKDKLVTVGRDYGGSFGRAISLLKGSFKEEMQVHYNLFRLIDSFEDCIGLEKYKKIGALNDIKSFVKSSDMHSDFILEHAHNALNHTKKDSLEYRVLNDAHLILDDYQIIVKGDKKKQHRYSLPIEKMIDIMVQFLPEDKGEYNKIQNFSEFDLYCLGVGGMTGNLIMESALDNGVIDGNTYNIVTSKNEGISNTERMGIFVQYVNMLKDVNEDIKNKKHALPRKQSEDVGTEIVVETIKHSLPYFHGSLQLLKQLENANKELKQFIHCSLSLYISRLEKITRDPNVVLYGHESEISEKIDSPAKNYVKKVYMLTKMNLFNHTRNLAEKIATKINYAIQM